MLGAPQGCSIEQDSNPCAALQANLINSRDFLLLVIQALTAFSYKETNLFIISIVKEK